MQNYSYVYVLDSRSAPSQRYFGMTDDLERRLREHNTGGCLHTSKFAPWRIRAATAFRDREHAAAFEKHLKTHSGRIFAKRWF
jgi:putative endonuclease